ncbi:PREDICTED: mediator of RNA polymerase II transcription subunit 16 [Rhagoletis zephyria]|uniref:mediator of RNA polymerase II transcription subunit 16 n=1 Tax=Rhagoletis zephyria TaxID=28612 RepID=UPI0008113057|nr:PREDICTED: mediator of RNA polymerase II transcription subunit 16 [Rhagoletis zephyria]XP_036339795.1 mediator of RNA polymerase II transcription subunit 16 [Rhagoletis pomonella]
MTIIYKVHGNSTPNTNKRIICRISTRNVVAFSVLQELESESQIFVCDLISPWQTYCVTNSKNVLTVLEWSSNGELLLAGYNAGLIEIWTTEKELNSWFLLYKVNFPGEDIISAKFFHNGKSIYFHSQKKDLPTYADKFERLEHRPTVEHFGNAPTEGAVIITASGLVGAFITPHKRVNESNPHFIELKANTQSIGLSRFYISLCSMSHCSSGHLNVAVNYSCRPKIVYCFKIGVKLDNDNIFLKSEALPSIFSNTVNYKQISNIGWINSNKEDVLYIGYNTMDGSLLEQWHLSKKHQSVHKLLQKNKGDFVQSEIWENIAKGHFTAGISDVCSSKLLTQISQIYVVLRDNTVQIVEPGLKKVALAIPDRTMADDRYGQYKFVSADGTHMNQILVLFDNFGQMYAMQVTSPISEKNYKLNTLSLQTSLLEYSIITGIDPSDILMLNLGNLDILIEKLTENFTKQSTITRHFYYSNFLCLKSNMCRIQSRQQDFDNLIVLHTISITFKSLLRPADLSCQDKGPGDNLAMILSDQSTDIDKVLFSLDGKDFAVEPLTLQSLQQLIQWVSDLALSILNKLPNEVIKAKLSKKQGYDISRDSVAISSIRELLVMTRIWGLLNPQCLPTYTKSVENIDVLATLFRLLTRLAQNTAEPDDFLLDECSLLSTQVLIPQRQFNNPATLLNNHLSLYKSYPFIFASAMEPSWLKDINYEEVVFASGTKDGVSNLHLGAKASSLRRCIRCGLVNSLQNVAKTAAMKAWCQRWLYCHCGGYWMKV